MDKYEATSGASGGFSCKPGRQTVPKSGRPAGAFGPQSEKSVGDRKGIGRADGLALALLGAGASPETVARRLAAQARLSAAEAELRVVELALGPLGRVRAASEDGVPDPRHAQSAVLRLAAQAFPDRIQRLGDRIYLDGRPVGLPDLVRRAREAGIRIRYPGLDPMERALSGGPSAARGRRRASWPYLLTGAGR
jgi:hypothetical protein